MTIQLGTISSGTLRTEDLLEAFAGELDYQRSHGAARDIAQSTEWLMLYQRAQTVDPESEEAYELLTELEDELNELAPCYVYFGAHMGDGADFGFWPQFDALDDAIQSGEMLKLDAGAEPPADYNGEMMFVTDHGNVTVGYWQDGRFNEWWAVV